MVKILLLLLGIFVSFASQAKVAMAISDEEKQALEEQKKAAAEQQTKQTETKTTENKTVLEK